MSFMKTATPAEILTRADYWGEDISFMLPEIEKTLEIINNSGMDAYYVEALS